MRDQEGFSAIGLFLLGLAMLFIMGASGLFNVPESEVEDEERYQATSSEEIEGKGLQISDLKFTTPSPTQVTPQPTRPPVVFPTPTSLPPDACIGYQPTTACTCYAPFHIATWCDGRQPPTIPDCDGPIAQCTDLGGKTGCIEYCAAKPVIYLYPEKPMFVNVKITTPGRFVDHIPPLEFFGNDNGVAIAGWTGVMAYPSGDLFYKNSNYKELFYDTSLSYVKAPDHGIFIERRNLKNELSKFVKGLGLNDWEAEEFTSYWVPKLYGLNKKYIFTSVVDQGEKMRVDKVEITPTPDTFIEFMAYFNGVDEVFASKPLTLSKAPERKGFTAVEWGGVIEPSSYK